MKKIIVFIFLVLIFVPACSIFGKQKIKVKKQPEESKALTMSVMKDRFEPAKLTINVNDKIVFFNEDDKVHQISLGEKEGIPLEKGKSWTYTFSTSGNFSIVDILNPSIKGEVIVE